MILFSITKTLISNRLANKSKISIKYSIMESLLISILIALIFFCGIMILFFLSRTLSPVPYFPSNYKDLKLIIKTLLHHCAKNKTTNTVIIDYGAGTGTVVFPAVSQAHKRNIPLTFIADMLCIG